MDSVCRPCVSVSPVCFTFDAEPFSDAVTKKNTTPHALNESVMDSGGGGGRVGWGRGFKRTVKMTFFRKINF